MFPATSVAVTQLLPDFFCKVIVTVYLSAVAEKHITASAVAFVLLTLSVVNPTAPVLYVEPVSANEFFFHGFPFNH